MIRSETRINIAAQLLQAMIINEGYQPKDNEAMVEDAIALTDILLRKLRTLESFGK